jgi:hypothetical protein
MNQPAENRELLFHSVFLATQLEDKDRVRNYNIGLC